MPERADEALSAELRRMLAQQGSPGPAPIHRVLARIARRTRLRRLAKIVATGGLAVVIAVAVVQHQVTEESRETVIAAGGGETYSAQVAEGNQFAGLGEGPGGVAYLVATGTVEDRAWTVASTGFGSVHRACMLGADEVIDDAATCAGSDGPPVAWQPVDQLQPAVSAVGAWGFVTADVAGLQVRTRSGAVEPVVLVTTPTSKDVRFFAWLTEGTDEPVAIEMLDRDGSVHRSVPPTTGRGCRDVVNPDAPCPVEEN
ncbi:MAG TPA: hypothetical protein VFD41_06645 [Actinomycetales bacterium]|nr:hypothetical protein [Actinomycetales bacterium]